MILIDSSSCVHYFRRRGDAIVRQRVAQLLERGEAAWCAFIRLELWHGVGSAGDRRILHEDKIWMPDLPLWMLSGMKRARWPIALAAPAPDILIAACARYQKVDLERTDAHFDFLLTL
jgi:predicted nucleic acid-binding protein